MRWLTIFIVLFSVLPSVSVYAVQDEPTACVERVPDTLLDPELLIFGADGSILRSIHEFDPNEIASYLNQGIPFEEIESKLEDVLTFYNANEEFELVWDVRAYHTHINDDDAGDLLLEIVVSEGDSPDGFVEGALFSFICVEDDPHPSLYQGTLVTPIGGFYGGDYMGEVTGFLNTIELNGDDFAEVVTSIVYAIGTRGYFGRTIGVYQWDADEYVWQRLQSDMGAGLPQIQMSNGTVWTHNDRILLREQHVDRHNPYDVSALVRPRIQEWEWSGMDLILACERRFGEAEFLIQVAQDIDNQIFCGNYDKARAIYETVELEPLRRWDIEYNTTPELVDESVQATNPHEFPFIKSYMMYRMVLIDLLQGDLASAEERVLELDAYTAGGRAGRNWADMAMIVHMVYADFLDLQVACDQITDFIMNDVENFLDGGDIYTFYFGEGYFSSFVDNPNRWCIVPIS